MNTISTLVIILLIALGFVALAPIFALGMVFLMSAGFFLLWLLPILIIASSEQTCGIEKAAWIAAIIFLSWFAWVLYYFLAPLKSRQDPRHDYHYYSSIQERRHYHY